LTFPLRRAIATNPKTLCNGLTKKGRGSCSTSIRISLNHPRDEAVYRITSDITKEFENAIRDTPEQWIWMHRRWRTKPEKEKYVPGGFRN
jgi:lauroyl/myristoyl acyltransferase